MKNQIQFKIQLPLSAQAAFEAWLSEKTHGQMIDGSAKIDPREQGKFEIWEGSIEGVTTKIDKKGLIIEQDWRYDLEDWPAGEYSQIRLKFIPKDEKNCTLEFIQNGVPQVCEDSIRQGWADYYFEPMRDYFSRR